VSGEAATEAPEFAPKKRFLESDVLKSKKGQNGLRRIVGNGLRRIVGFGEIDELYKSFSVSV
jgi:hypothetical protein